MIEKVKLTQEEKNLWQKIDYDELRESIEPAYKLSKSLLKRKVIPSIRIKYFTEPEFNIGGRGKSREEIFKRNGTEGELILKHPGFHKYLKYFILGPDLPLEIINEFRKLVDNCKPVTSGDIELFCKLSSKQVKANQLYSNSIAEEYYKLCLELELSEVMARIIRDKIKKIK